MTKKIACGESDSESETDEDSETDGDETEDPEPPGKKDPEPPVEPPVKKDPEPPVEPPVKKDPEPPTPPPPVIIDPFKGEIKLLKKKLINPGLKGCEKQVADSLLRSNEAASSEIVKAQKNFNSSKSGSD